MRDLIYTCSETGRKMPTSEVPTSELQAILADRDCVINDADGGTVEEAKARVFERIRIELVARELENRL